ncbi:hypothetical protein MBLNU457_g0368t2 [Dothideomycetes sp. NU457]
MITEGEEPVVSGAEGNEDAENTAPSNVGTLDSVSSPISNDTTPSQPCTDDLDVRVEAQQRHVYRHLNNSALSLNPDMYYFPDMDLDEGKQIRRVGAGVLDETIGVAIGAEAYLFGVFVAERFGLL